MCPTCDHIVANDDGSGSNVWDGPCSGRPPARGSDLPLALLDMINQVRPACPALRKRRSQQVRLAGHRRAIVYVVAARDPAGAELSMQPHVTAQQAILSQATDGEKHDAE